MRKKKKKGDRICYSIKILIQWLNKKIFSFFRFSIIENFACIIETNKVCITIRVLLFAYQIFEFGSSFTKFSFIFTFFHSSVRSFFSIFGERKRFPIYVRNLSFIRFSTLTHISSFLAEHFFLPHFFLFHTIFAYKKSILMLKIFEWEFNDVKNCAPIFSFDRSVERMRNNRSLDF